MMPPQKGFTLLEVLVAIGLFGVIIITISNLLVLSKKNMEITINHIRYNDEIRAAQVFLRRVIQKIDSVGINKEGKTVVFIGRKNHMEFLAPVSIYLGGGVKIYSIEASSSIEVKLFNPNKTQWGKENFLLKSVNITEISFSYKGRDPKNESTGWLTEWPLAERLPDFIRIEAILSKSKWPTLVINLKASSDARINR